MGKATDVGEKLIPGTPVPVPVTAKHCGDPAALSVTQMEEASAPATFGENVTLMVQVPDGTTVEQLFVWVKDVEFPPVGTTAVMTRLPEPGFDTVTAVGDELVPTVCAANAIFVGENPICGVAVVPVQVSGTL